MAVTRILALETSKSPANETRRSPTITNIEVGSSGVAGRGFQESASSSQARP